MHRCYWRSGRLGVQHGAEPSYAGLQVGCADILGRIVEDLKDESEPYRRMVMETIDKVVSDLGTADVDARLEELLIDGILYAFQEQVGAQGSLLTAVLRFCVLYGLEDAARQCGWAVQAGLKGFAFR